MVVYLGEHFGGREPLEVSHGSGRSLLELDVMEFLVQIDCVVPGHWFKLLLLAVSGSAHAFCY